MFKTISPEKLDSSEIQFPHCDPRILHAPNECQFCDKHIEWQFLRQMWGIAFTGYQPEGTKLPDPATHARGDKVNYWTGNRKLGYGPVGGTTANTEIK